MLQAVYETCYFFRGYAFPKKMEEVLNNYSTYYIALSPSLKYRFKQRLFINLKVIRFSSANNFILKAEMKILIASAMVQFSMGLNRYILDRYRNIKVVPRPYRYPTVDGKILGEVKVERGIIILNWPSVIHGFTIPNDAENVAIHEISHAVKFENELLNLNRKFYRSAEIQEWEKEILKSIYESIHKGTSCKNTTWNMEEMFANGIEMFFEQPAILQKELPRLFNQLKALLNQNPLLPENPIINRNKWYHPLFNRKEVHAP